MGRIKNDRESRACKDWDGTHVRNEGVVSEAGAALAQKQVGVARSHELVGHVEHVPGREELALFDVNGPPSLRSSDQEISLAAQEGRYLQDVNGFCCRRTLLRRVNIGEDRATKSLADFGQYGEPFAHAQPPRAYQTGSVRFVERAFYRSDSAAVRQFPAGRGSSPRHQHDSRLRMGQQARMMEIRGGLTGVQS